MTPRVESVDSSRVMKFARPTEPNHSAEITFKFTPTGHPKDTGFGIKQFVSVSYRCTLKGNKSTDGLIGIGFTPRNLFTLDVSTQRLDVLFDAADMPTGARATATQAPFFSTGLSFVKSGTEVELSITDRPGGAIPLEMRNVATDRMNYLESVRTVERFLTVLTAVDKNNTHTPLEAKLWQSTVDGTVTWDESGRPDVTKVSALVQGMGTFPDIGADFLYCDFALLTNPSLTAADSIVQEFNDAMFAVRGMYKRQNFSTPTRGETKLESKGYRLTQYPTTV